MGGIVEDVFEGIVDLFMSLVDFCVSGSVLHRTLATMAVLVVIALFVVIFRKK